MKTKLYFLLALAVLTAAVVGCVNTVSGRKTAAVPWMRDRIEGHYDRSVDQVYTAACAVMRDNGAINFTGEMNSATNLVKFIEGKVRQCNVWIRTEQIEPAESSVIVQVRTAKGGTDLLLAHQLEKEIALKLVR
jgi:hypothetical protein